MVIFKERKKCDYCWQFVYSEDLKKIILRIPFKGFPFENHYETKSINVCSKCRGTLTGLWKYDRGI
jgi:hypothetical protein